MTPMFSALRACWLFGWELPQNTLGLGLLVGLRLLGRKSETVRDRRRLFIETDGMGISLGWFVFWTKDWGPRGPVATDRTRNHEYGHSIQSRLFGPLYLLLVGIPSVSRVAWSSLVWRRTGTRWPHYYRGWPENNADWLGGVEHPRNRPVEPEQG